MIGLISEYDALDGLSQDRCTERRPVRDGAPGHACGHCTLGAAVLGAALSLKTVMEQDGLPGTLRFYGCPAEETVEGKVLMSRDRLLTTATRRFHGIPMISVMFGRGKVLHCAA